MRYFSCRAVQKQKKMEWVIQQLEQERYTTVKKAKIIMPNQIYMHEHVHEHAHTRTRTRCVYTPVGTSPQTVAKQIKAVCKLPRRYFGYACTQKGVYDYLHVCPLHFAPANM